MSGIDKYLLKNGQGAKGKDIDAKRRVVAQMATGDQPIADIAKALDISIPTVTKLITDLTTEGIAEDLGKVETAGGRRPNIFGLTDVNVHFVGAEIADNKVVMVVTDLRGNIVASETKQGNTLEILERFARAHNAVAAGVCVAGRVNPFAGQSESLDKQDIESRLGIPACMDNTTRARCRTELHADAGDMLYADLGHTLTAAIASGGAIYYGHSGLGGELHNTPLIESGIEKIIADARRDDPRAIEQIERAAEKAGRDIASMLSLLNPETVVVGGPLACAGDYLMLPLQAAIHKHTPRALYRDTRFRLAAGNEYTAATGAAAIIRDITLGLK
jgi:predicted NBD/HSP70 family sugar kinase/DNA-binding CsgD family transcriptional regulator